MTSKILSTPWPFLAIIAAHVIWGANLLVAKYALQEFPTMSLAFLRFFLAVILLLPFVMTERRINFKVADLPKFVLAGVTLVTLSIALFFEGIIRTSVSDAAVLLLLLPIISLIGSWIFLKERIFTINLVGILTGLVGALLIIGLPLFLLKTIDGRSLLGNILILLAAITGVVGALVSKNLLKTYSPLFLTWMAFLIGSITFFIPAANEYLQNPDWMSNVTILGMLGLGYMTIFSSIFGYLLLEWSLSKISVAQVNLFHYIEPLVAVTLGVILLGEQISFSFIIGSLLIGLGVYWGTLGKPTHHHPHLKSHRV